MRINEIVEGEVVEIVSYGVRVDIGNVKALVKLPDISWDSFAVNVEDHIHLGQKIKIKIRSIGDKEIYASIRDVHPEGDPWRSVPEVGEIVSANVVMVAEYGYILRLKKNLYGLLNFDDASLKYAENESLNVKISNIDFEKKRISCVEINL